MTYCPHCKSRDVCRDPAGEVQHVCCDCGLRFGEGSTPYVLSARETTKRYHRLRRRA